MPTTVTTAHTARQKHKNPCEWCGEPIDKGDNWVKHVTMGGDFFSSSMHAECNEAFNDEFQHYWPGALLGFDPHCNDRGQPAKEGTIYEV